MYQTFYDIKNLNIQIFLCSVEILVHSESEVRNFRRDHIWLDRFIRHSHHHVVELFIKS